MIAQSLEIILILLYWYCRWRMHCTTEEAPPLLLSCIFRVPPLYKMLQYLWCNQIHNIVNIKEFCSLFMPCGSSTLPVVANRLTWPIWRKGLWAHGLSNDMCFKKQSLLCLMNPLAVAMAMLVLITTPRLLATLRNFWTFKFISLKRSGLPCSFSSCTFEDRFPFVACVISIRYFDLNVQKVLSLRFLDFWCFIAAEFPFTEAYFPIS